MLISNKCFNIHGVCEIFFFLIYEAQRADDTILLHSNQIQVAIRPVCAVYLSHNEITIRSVIKRLLISYLLEILQ